MKSSSDKKERAAAAPSAAEDRAGTGQGRRQNHSVTEVAFNANAGMYSVRDVLKIFYEFASEPDEPQPFLSRGGEDKGRFTQEMPL
jgi:hypothetical protein